jgi:hypothetical protein
VGRILSGLFVTVVGGVIVWYLTIGPGGGNGGGGNWGNGSGGIPPSGPMVVTVTPNPPVISRGQQTRASVYVQDSHGRPLPQATVTLSSGGGRFNRTGTSTVSGATDSSGSYTGYWSCDPCAPAYMSGVRVTKPGLGEANARWQVQIR